MAANGRVLAAWHAMARHCRTGVGVIALALAGWPGGLRAWTPDTYPAGSSGFTVDTLNRNDVVSFWHGVYQASEGYQDRHAWTGNYTATSPYTNAEGATSAAFVTDIERRLNFYRALCKIPAGVSLNSGASVLIDATDPTNLYHPASTPSLAASVTKAAAAQRAAYMIIRTYGYAQNGTIYPPLGNATAAMSHTPLAAQCVAWTTAAWNANNHGNLALGFYGPGAIDAYMAENVSGLDYWNDEVGHRQWILYPPSTDFATGDTPGSFDAASSMIRPPTNALYVIPKTSETGVVTPQFVAYPPAGYFPTALNSGFWSLSYPEANFGAATVTMTTASGGAVPVTVIKRGGTHGNPVIVWQVTGSAAATAVIADSQFNVTVSGMTGTGVPTSYAYAVTLIDPNQLTSDQCLFGPGAPNLTEAATYQITPPSMAEAIQVNSFQPAATAWTEGAEDSPTPAVIAHTAASYAFRSTAHFTGDPGFSPISGAKSFRLTIPVWYDPRLNGVPEQSFELDRELLPGSAATLNFKFWRGYMSPGTNLAVESSSDGGVTWTAVGAAISGAGNLRDAASTTTTRTLATATTPIRVRFRLSVSPGMGFYADQLYNGYDYTAIPTGIFIDDISTTNCQWLELKKTNELAAIATSFNLTGTSAGVTPATNLDLRLRMRTKLGNRWMPSGPMKTVIYNAAEVTSAPVINPPGAAYAAGQVITITSESNATICYRINGGTEVSAANPLTNIIVPADSSTLTLTAYAKKTGKSDSTIVSASYTSSPFMTWMNTYFPGITDPNVVGPQADPDNDGQTNLLEFALGGNPNGADGRAMVYQLTSDGGEPYQLLLTLVVRAGATFNGSPSPMATQDGVTYAIQGGLSLDSFTSAVSVVPEVSTGLPPAPAGYEYRTFRLDDSAGLPDKGFLRVRVNSAP